MKFDPDWERRVATALCELEAERIEAAIDDADPEALARWAGLGVEEAKVALNSLPKASEEAFVVALDAAIAELRPVEPMNGKNVTALLASPKGAKKKSKKPWEFMGAGLVAASLTLALWPSPSQHGPVVVRLDPLALGETAFKSSAPASGPIVWRPGTRFHVRLVPDAADRAVTAWAYLRTGELVRPLPVRVDWEDDGLHVRGTVGRELDVPLGAHSLVVVAGRPGNPPRPSSDWNPSASTVEGQPAFWFSVTALPPFELPPDPDRRPRTEP